MNDRRVFPVIVAVALSSCGSVTVDRVVTNPVDLDYAFYQKPDSESIYTIIPPALLNMVEPEKRDSVVNAVMKVLSSPKRSGVREAADPVVEVYKGRYYLFASMSKGYWSSDDMQHWKYLSCDVLPLAFYAPTSMVYKDELYWMTSDINSLYKTTTPEEPSSWQLVTDKLNPYPDEPQLTVHDPDLFLDDDGRVYLYWGCSDQDDIYGIELDPDNKFRSKGKPIKLIAHQEKQYGWEQPGNHNEIDKPGYNEGASMLKHDGRYYLQYAGPGTEYDSYGDGLYVADSPLGPYLHADYSPISIKPGGWLTGAGHGDSFLDKNANLWHVATNVISQRMNFERRIGFFPMVMTAKNHLYAMTEWSDLPYILPDKKTNFSKCSPWTGWMDLSIHKNIQASSSLKEHPACNAADNTIKSWWSAETGRPGEWLTIDLGTRCRVNAVHPNFADQDFGFYNDTEKKTPYKYIVEASENGEQWTTIFDRRNNETLNPHELLVLKRPVKARFIRVTNTTQLTGKFSVFDLRVFGLRPGAKPGRVDNFTITRGKDERRISVSWPKAHGATGYVLHWGTEPDELYNSCRTENTFLEQGLYSVGQHYYFRVDSYNESGITKGKTIKK